MQYSVLSIEFISPFKKVEKRILRLYSVARVLPISLIDSLTSGGDVNKGIEYFASRYGSVHHGYRLDNALADRRSVSQIKILPEA